MAGHSTDSAYRHLIQTHVLMLTSGSRVEGAAAFDEDTGSATFVIAQP
jgi:hypothetical protein